MEKEYNLDIEDTPTIYPFPKDRSGYLHIFGKDQKLLEFLSKHDNSLAYEVLDAMISTCFLVNAVHTMRKREVSFEIALEYCLTWSAILPWRDMKGNYPFLEKYGHYIFEDDDFDPLFLDMLSKSQLKQRDEALKKLYHKIIAVLEKRISWYIENPNQFRQPHQQLPEEFDFLYPYLEYAFQDLVTSWDDRDLSFTAPIFRIGAYQEKTYNTSCNTLVPLNYLPLYEIVSVFHCKTNEIIEGYFDEDGDFQVSQYLSFDRKLCHRSKREWLKVDE